VGGAEELAELFPLLCVSENCYKCPQRAFYGHCNK